VKFAVMILEASSMLLCYGWAYSLLNDFLINSVGRKKARKLRKTQKIKDQILLNYIKPSVKKRQKAFARYLRLYQLWFYSRMIVVIFCLLYLFTQLQYLTLGILIDSMLNLVIATIFRLPLWPGSNSRSSVQK